MARLGVLIALFGSGAAVLSFAGYEHVSYSWMGAWGDTVAVVIQLGTFIAGFSMAVVGSMPDQTGSTARLAKKSSV